MSTLQVANIHFESTGNTRFVYDSSTQQIYLFANVASQTLTDGATITWNANNGKFATVTLTGNNRTFANLVNVRQDTYVLYVKQDGTGTRVISTWGSMFKWPGGVAPVLTTTANAVDVFSFVSDGNNMYGTYINDVK